MVRGGDSLTAGDLVEVPPVKTVIQLADLEDPDLRAGLVDSFVLTSEAEFALRTVLGAIADQDAKGFFLQGNYGSGKSHLLAVLGLVLASGSYRTALLEKVKPASPLADALSRLGSSKYVTLKISLVEYSNREYLETAFLKALEESREFGCALALRPPPRREAFDAISRLLSENGFAGLVILIDELSEYLRSKPDGPSFNEDIRFLQFLGEESRTLPAWVVASLQEGIENTGEIPPRAFNKIKDRYPVRLHLTGEHVRELIDRRLIVKKPGAAGFLKEMWEGLRTAFGTLPFDYDEFAASYPVHPSTVAFLDELRPLFSQHRGVVDFIYSRLTGDRSRRIERFLDRPANELLTPEVIFDHFRDRIRETPETNPYSERVCAFFEREVKDLFPDPADARAALRLVKLAILGAISPARRFLDAKQMTEMLFFRVTDIQPDINYRYVEDILGRLLKAGAYLARVEGEGPTRVTVDLEADVGLILQRRLEHVLTGLPSDAGVMEGLIGWVNEAYLPLAALAGAEDQVRSVRWQNTSRDVRVVFERLEELALDVVSRFADLMTTTETDMVVVISRTPEPRGATGILEAWKEIPGVQGLAIWVPRALSPHESRDLREALAYKILADEYEAPTSKIGGRVLEHLRSLLPDRQRCVREVFRSAYFEGHIAWLTVDGPEEMVPQELGYIAFDSLLERLAGAVLRRRFPRHIEVMPKTDALTVAMVKRAATLLESLGTVNPDTSLDYSVKLAVEGFLRPLGLVKRVPGGITLSVDTEKCALLSTFLSLIPEGEGRVPLDKVYWNLRKGPFGLSKHAFELIATALIYTGTLTAWRGGRRMSKLGPLGVWESEELERGELMSEELRSVLPTIHFLSPRHRKEPLTYNAQQEVWQAVIEARHAFDRDLGELRTTLERVRGYEALKPLNVALVEKQMDKLGALMDEVKTSYSSREGLERFLAAYRTAPWAEECWNRLFALRRFLVDDLDRLLFISGYLRSPGLVIPDTLEYSEANQLRRTLLELLQDEGVFFRTDIWERVEEEFARFQRLYSDLYQSEHEKWRGSAAFQPYQVLLESDAFVLLERLSKLDTLGVVHDFGRVRADLEETLKMCCARFRDETLREGPLCACGFRLGEKTATPPPAHFLDLARTGVAEHFDALHEPQVLELLRGYLHGLDEVGRRREADRVRAFLALDPRHPDFLQQGRELGTETVITLIHQALAGRRVVLVRDIGDLARSLLDRTFRRSQVMEVMSDWLGEPEDPSVYFKIVRTERAKTPRSIPGEPDMREAIRDAAGDYERFRVFVSLIDSDRRPSNLEKYRKYLSGQAPEAPDNEVGAVAASPHLREVAADTTRLVAAIGTAKALDTTNWNWEDWSRSYREIHAVIPWLLATVTQKAATLGLLPALPLAAWSTEWHQVAKRDRPAFESLLRDCRRDGASQPPSLLLALERFATQSQRQPDANGAFVFVLDCMRLDVAELVLQELAPCGVQVIDSGVCWAVLPTTTEAQMASLGDWQVSRYSPELMSDVSLYGRPALEHIDLAVAGKKTLLKWDFIDDLVHALRCDLAELASYVRSAVRHQVAPFVRALPHGSSILLAGDHGFTENPLFEPRHKLEQPRYLHGGQTPEEVIVPWFELSLGNHLPTRQSC